MLRARQSDKTFRLALEVFIRQPRLSASVACRIHLRNQLSQVQIALFALNQQHQRRQHAALTDNHDIAAADGFDPRRLSG